MRKISIILAIIVAFAALGCFSQGVAFAAPSMTGPNVGAVDPTNPDLTRPSEDKGDNAIDTSIYSNVLDDLLKDETFNVSDYPEIYGDYGLEVIQVAESTAGELFVYVYQHSADPLCEALSIRISQTVGENLSPHDYDLLLLNVDSENKTIAKYLVKGITLKQDVQRYYEIIQITRQWIEGYDKEPASGNTVNEFAIGVSKLFTLTTIDSEVTYSEEHSDVIYITAMYTGNLFYMSKANGSSGVLDWGGVGFDVGTSHYVVFSTDRQIDKLQEAEVAYVYQNWSYTDWSWNLIFDGVDESKFNYEDPILDQVTLYADDYTILPGTQGRTYSWKRIQSVRDFISDNEDLKDDVVARIKSMQWVLRFRETEVSMSANAIKSQGVGTKVSDVTILRLKFLTNGKVFNLGTVANKQTGSGIDNGVDDTLKGWKDFLDRLEAFFDRVGAFFKKVGAWCAEYWWVLVIAGGLFLIGIMSIFLKPVWFVVKWILKIFWYIISAPARLIVAIINRIRERRNE